VQPEEQEKMEQSNGCLIGIVVEGWRLAVGGL
jgi:hypothetical protein